MDAEWDPLALPSGVRVKLQVYSSRRFHLHATFDPPSWLRVAMIVISHVFIDDSKPTSFPYFPSLMFWIDYELFQTG